MTLSIENKENSGIALLEPDGSGLQANLRPFAFSGQRVDIPPGRRYLIRVPESTKDEGLIAVKNAREQIPVQEAMGRDLDAYIIESLPEGQGGKVNSKPVEAGVHIEDLGIIFIGA
jgi:hypothetical protein